MKHKINRINRTLMTQIIMMDTDKEDFFLNKIDNNK